MFACMALNLEFCKKRINLFVALAPVARVGGCDGKFLKPAANSSAFCALLEHMGPEIMPVPNVDDKFKKMFLKFTNLDDTAFG